jgi:hypothetical protein
LKIYSLTNMKKSSTLSGGQNALPITLILKGHQMNLSETKIKTIKVDKSYFDGQRVIDERDFVSQWRRPFMENYSLVYTEKEIEMVQEMEKQIIKLVEKKFNRNFERDGEWMEIGEYELKHQY